MAAQRHRGKKSKEQLAKSNEKSQEGWKVWGKNDWYPRSKIMLDMVGF